MMKLGYLKCQCGAALKATRNRVCCIPCEKTIPRAAAVLHIAMIAIERGLCVDPASIQADDRRRLVFLYRDAGEA